MTEAPRPDPPPTPPPSRGHPPGRGQGQAPSGDQLDRYDLYATCVQAPAEQAALLAAIHGGDPLRLGEDFCGTAAVSAAWVRSGGERTAIAVDRDPEALARAARHPAITVRRGDVREVPPAEVGQLDVVYAGNFSVNEMHARSDLVRYLRGARSRLRRGGVFVCDLYGGADAWTTGIAHDEVRLPGGGRVRYEWEQCRIDPLTARVVNAIHFELEDGRGRRRLERAFTYDWRLWGLAELRDAMADAGFASAEAYARQPDAVDDAGVLYVTPLAEGDLDESFQVLLAARRDTPDSIDAAREITAAPTRAAPPGDRRRR